MLHALGVEPVNKIGGVADFEGIKANIPFVPLGVAKRGNGGCPCTRDGTFGIMNMDLGDIRLRRSPAASGGASVEAKPA